MWPRLLASLGMFCVRLKGTVLSKFSLSALTQRDKPERPILFRWAFRPQCPVRRQMIMVGWARSSARIGSKCAWFVCLFVGCLTSQQHASVSPGRICSDKFTCCHTEIEVADQTFHLTQSQYTGTGPTSPSADPITPGAWQGSHWSANFEVNGMTRPRKNPAASGIRTRDLPLSRRTP